MIIAIWIIAICEIIRLVQNALQLRMLRHSTGSIDNVQTEFIKSLKTDDRQFVENMLRECERMHGEDAE